MVLAPSKRHREIGFEGFAQPIATGPEEDILCGLLIEVAWGKQRIMEIYLNVVEWGPGIYGAETAAQHYFHKPAAGLTIGEAVRLAAVLPDPLNWSPLRPTRRVLARSAAISSNMPAVPRRCLRHAD